MKRPRILSGMRPTGALHLGNYMGALDNWVALQDPYECFFSIVDWHSLTTDYADPSAIRENVIEVATDGTAAAVTEMLGRLEAAKTPAAKLSVHRPSLDDVFLSLTDKERT